jgi:hypothetical protein
MKEGGDWTPDLFVLDLYFPAARETDLAHQAYANLLRLWAEV